MIDAEIQVLLEMVGRWNRRDRSICVSDCVMELNNYLLVASRENAAQRKREKTVDPLLMALQRITRRFNDVDEETTSGQFERLIEVTHKELLDVLSFREKELSMRNEEMVLPLPILPRLMRFSSSEPNLANTPREGQIPEHGTSKDELLNVFTKIREAAELLPIVYTVRAVILSRLDKAEELRWKELADRAHAQSMSVPAIPVVNETVHQQAQASLGELRQAERSESQSIKSDRISKSTIARMAGNILSGVEPGASVESAEVQARWAVNMARLIAMEVNSYVD